VSFGDELHRAIVKLSLSNDFRYGAGAFRSVFHPSQLVSAWEWS